MSASDRPAASAVALERLPPRERFGCKGPRAADWLSAHGISTPSRANTWTVSGEGDSELLVARLGAAEFFVESAADGRRRSPTDSRADGAVDAAVDAAVDGAVDGVVDGVVTAAARKLATHPAGVYPVLREDWCLALSGAACDDVLVQVCNLQFAALDPAERPVIMTLMVGVAVLVVPQAAADGTRCYRIWCDPTFGVYLSETLGAIVLESGGKLTGVSV